MDTGDYEEAIAAFEALGDYKDSKILIENILKSDEYLRSVDYMRTLQPGDHIMFGSYEQDNDLSDGKEEIEWIILDKNADHLFVISRYALACRHYYDIYASINWEQAALRNWLNTDFYNDAFSDEDKEIIIKSDVKAEQIPNSPRQIPVPTRRTIYTF